MEEKINKPDCIKIKNSCAPRNTINREKAIHTVFASDVPDKRLIYTKNS